MVIHNRISRYFLGSAFVQARHLRYSALDTWPDDCVGCCNSNSHHRIPALISSSQYQYALSNSGISKNALFDVGLHPKIMLLDGTKLPYLHGEAHVKGLLYDRSDGEEWVCVNLYQAEIPAVTQRLIREYFRKHHALCDGDVYLMVRF